MRKSLRHLEVQESWRRWKAFVKHLHSPGFLWPSETPRPDQITPVFLSLSLSIFLWDRKVNPAVVWFYAEMVTGSGRGKQKTSRVRDGGRIIRLVTESASLPDYYFFFFLFRLEVQMQFFLALAQSASPLHDDTVSRPSAGRGVG